MATHCSRLTPLTISSCSSRSSSSSGGGCNQFGAVASPWKKPAACARPGRAVHAAAAFSVINASRQQMLVPSSLMLASPCLQERAMPVVSPGLLGTTGRSRGMSKALEKGGLVRGREYRWGGKGRREKHVVVCVSNGAAGEKGREGLSRSQDGQEFEAGIGRVASFGSGDVRVAVGGATAAAAGAGIEAAAAGAGTAAAGGAAASGASGEEQGPAGVADYVRDVELSDVVDEILTLELRHEGMVRSVSEFMRSLSGASRQLSARAQLVRLEAAKLKKASRMQQRDGIERIEEMRRAVEAKAAAEKKMAEVVVERERVRMMEAAVAREREELEKRLGEVDEMVREREEAAAAAAAASAAADAAAEKAAEERERGSASDAPSASEAAIATAAAEAAAAAAEAAAAASSSGLEIGNSTLTFPPSSAADLGPDAVSLPEVLECHVAHPGAISCTRTAITKDDVNKVAVVTMETTVRCAGEACSSSALDSDDYVELAMQALMDTAHEVRHSRFGARGRGEGGPMAEERRSEIVALLQEGEVVEWRPMEPPSKFGHKSYVVKLRDRQSGQELAALFKPRVEGDADGWHRAPIEWVAFELNLMLGMDYIPPVAYRHRQIDMDNCRYEGGAFIYWVPNPIELRKVAADNWGVSVARLLSDTRVLDVLLNNSDRHHGHFLYGPHWVKGQMSPLLIDHAAGFRKEAVVNMEHENAFQTGPTRCVCGKTYLRLRFLEEEVVREKFKRVLSQEEISGMMRRRDELLSYLDNLVQERGYHRTVIE